MAYVQTRSGLARSGAAHAAGCPRAITITVDGTTRTSRVIWPSFVLTQRRESPSTLMMDVRGFTPEVGQRVDVLYKVPNVYEFTGTILRVTGDSQNQHQDVVWTIEAADDRWLLDRFALVTGFFASRDINGIVAEVLASSTNGGFTVGSIPGRPDVTELDAAGVSFSGARLSEFLDSLRSSTSLKHWYVTPERHVSINSTNLKSLSLSDWVTVLGDYPVWDVSYGRDITQARTRVTVVGRATTVAVAAAMGATTLYVADASPFSASGGTARVGVQDVTYTSTGTATVNGVVVGTLTGVSGVVADIPVQAEIRPLSTANDTTAQTDLAALLGLSGIVVGEERRADAGQGATAQMAARALSVSADAVPLETLRYATRASQVGAYGRTLVLASAPFGSLNTVIDHVEITLTRTRDAFGDDFIRRVTCATRVEDFNAQLSHVMHATGRAS